MITNDEVPMDVASMMSEIRELPTEFIYKSLNGSLNIDDIKSYTLYDMLFRLRHDYVHWTICHHRGIPFGEVSLSQINQINSIASSHHNWKYIKNQSPDIVIVNGMLIKITEITISKNLLAKKEKITKYSLLVDTLKKCGFTVDTEIIVVSNMMSDPGSSSLVEEHGLSIDVVDKMYNVISRINSQIHMIESTHEGQEWYIRRSKMIFHDLDMGITKEQVREYFRKCQNKMFYDEDHLESIMDDSNMDNDMTQDDYDYMEKVAEIAENMTLKMGSSDDFKSSFLKLCKYHDKFSNSREYRSFLPLPYMRSITEDSSTRSTKSDEEIYNDIRFKLHETKDPLLSKLGDMRELRQRLYLSETERSNIALQGPGRKHYIKKNSIPHIERQRKFKNYWFNFNDSVINNDIENLLFRLSNISKISLDDPNEMSGVGLDYIKCCQSIYREISINAMRKDRRHEYLFKPTGVRGINLLMYPGAKLRTGENQSTIWFKLITTPEFVEINHLTSHWAFKSWNRDKEILHTSWLSVDANRLDHYIRCYDRILMSYLAYCHSGCDHLDQYIKCDKSNTLGTIIAIYMEDKRSTSKMIQDIRYLVMGSLSKYRWWSDLLEKYEEPLRTPLQSYLLFRSMIYCEDMTTNLPNHIRSFKFGKVYQDSDLISDKLSGVISSLPRVLTSGGQIQFPQLLCEMYFTMLFNKNQDDQTHSTFQILDKMLEGEKSLLEVKSSTNLHMGGHGTIDEISVLINNPHKNQFSSRAMMIGSKLQSIDQSNQSPAGLSHRKAAQNSQLNKPLSEFATYKSSAMFENPVLNRKILTKEVRRKIKNKDTIEEEFRMGDEDDDTDTVIISRQNPRRRCIEGIIELIQSGHTRSFDVIKDTITDEMYFQVFKKNQIGGAREILILPIEKRITINILESFSRLICKDDSREMLTHGDIKLNLMKDMVRDVKRSKDQKRIILNYNLDKTRWGPSFMPIQFIYMFKPFSRFYPSLYRYLLLTLMVHTNKKCLIPEKLIKVWLNDPLNIIKHNSKGDRESSVLQDLKEKFLKDEKLYFENESNMGQGILHYTSSYLHICALSFRDQIYKKLCQKNGIDPGVWRDIVSSDDSYTAQSLPLDNAKKINKRVELFIRSQEVTERLFNIWTSKSKSSISYLISEFNSMFGSNLTLFPTLFKFALASVMPFNTDSFFRMVKESFNTTRQIVENGGSLQLYSIAHKLNKTYCEGIYHTYNGGINDFNSFGLRKKYVPYQLGVYPIMHPGIMIILGPECHNYNILHNIGDLDKRELNLLYSTHTIIPIRNPELYAELNNFDNIFTGLLRIEAAMGPVKKLQRIKRQIDMTWAQMNDMIDNDVLITLREPETVEEMKLHTYLKLFSYGSSEALKDTAASIYYARVSASVTAKAFQIPYHNELSAKFDNKLRRMVGYTYTECLNHLINRENDIVDVSQFYPHTREFRDLLMLSSTLINYEERNPFETQNVRMLQLSEVTMRIKNPIRKLLESFWVINDDDKPTSFFRDWINLKEMVPIIQDSLVLTLENLSGDKTTKIKMLLLILMRIMGYSSKPMKAVMYGQSCRSYDHTFLVLAQQNFFHNYTNESLILNDNISSNPRIYDKLYFTFNHFILHLYATKSCLRDVEFDMNVLESYLRDNFISRSSKKKIMIMLLYLGHIEDICAWTMKTKTIMHHWIQRQSFSANNYHGNFKLLLQCGINKLRFEKDGKYMKLTLSTALNPTLNYELLQNASELTQMPIDMIINSLPPGGYIILAERIHETNTMNGKKIYLDDISDIHYHTDQLKITEEGDVSQIVLYDHNGYQIFKTPLGLLATDYIPLVSEFYDFNINGLSIIGLSELRIFSVNFSYQHISSETMINLLDDLEVQRPRITSITQERLQGVISKDWQIKDFNDVFNEADDFVDEKIDFVDILMNTELTQDELSSIISPEDPYDYFLDPSLDIGLITSLPIISTKYQPQRILERVLTCKYQLIARSCVDIRSISKAAIRSIYKLTKNRNIVISLIFMYDLMYSTVETISPVNVSININSFFSEKFLDFEYDDLNII